MSSGADPTVSPYDVTKPDAGVQASGEHKLGTTIGRYVVLGQLGRGGMGTVYEAHDPQLDRRVALKLLHPGTRVKPEHLIAEARALAKLDDRHVVQVFDAGEHDGEVFIAMQFVVGSDLATALATRRPSRQQILAWFIDAGRGLAAAHAAGLVHRDFKPTNVLVDRRGRVAVTDFGLAVTTDESAESAGSLAGTPLYMAPEQHAHEPATPASDQFAFCVACWEALFGKHPFVERADMVSAFAVGAKISEGNLLPPLQPSAVPRRVLDALTRGLSREPAKRWPGMSELLAELAPPKRRVGLALAVASTGLAVAAVAFAFGFRGSSTERSCEASNAARGSNVWSPARAAAIRSRFAAKHRASTALDTLDHYGTRWQALANELCTSDRPAQQACLDADLDKQRAVADLLDTASSDVVEHAADIVATLPDLGECADPKAFEARPAPALAGVVDAISSDLNRVIAQQSAGSTHTLDLARSVLARAEAMQWAPTIARAHIAIGHALALQYQPALDELVRGAELAVANHLDREAVHAWIDALTEAAYENKPDVIGTLLTAARTTASRVGDPALALEVEVAYGRSLIQVQRWDEGLAICRPAISAAEKLGRPTLWNAARDCLFEGLVPTGRLDELHAVAAERVAATIERFGPDASQLATYASLMADVDATNGRLADARKEIDQAMAVVTKAWPDGHHLKTAELLRIRASVEAAEGKPADALKTLREARDIALGIVPKPIVVLADVDTAIAFALAQGGDPKGALASFEEAIAAVRAQSSDSVALAVLLLNYGMVLGTGDFEGGLHALGEARAILDRKHDARSTYASAAMAVIEAQHHRWQDARTHAEEAVAFAAHDPNAMPANTAEVQFVLAQALYETNAGRPRAIEVARTARATYASLGPGSVPQVREIDRWLAAHH